MKMGRKWWRRPFIYYSSRIKFFVQKCTQIAVPTGAVALDECTIASSSSHRSKTYNPNKPQSYGITLYTVVGHKYKYLFALSDTDKGHLDASNSLYRFKKVIKKPLDSIVTSFHNSSITYINHLKNIAQYNHNLSNSQNISNLE